jgi:hypothetical protein
MQEVKADPLPDGGYPPFPKNLPHLAINKWKFEQGFRERCVDGVLDGTSLCAICRGFPRNPTTLDPCGHLFCAPCIKKWYGLRAEAHGLFVTDVTAPCPSCRTPFRSGEILTWELWQKWAQLSYNSKIVRCPFKCGFQGTYDATDKHQVFQCPKRKIECPSECCAVRGPAAYVEHVHFPRCPMLRVTCPTCRLPVKPAEVNSHYCIERLQEALLGTSRLRVN